MGFSSFRRRRLDSPDQSQEKQQGNVGNAGRASKVPRKKRGGRALRISPKAFELEMIPFPRNESRERKESVKRKVVEGSTLDEERWACPLERDVVKRVQRT